MYKLIISDLDGTLLNEKHTISEYTKEIIEKINKKGIHFFLATGRHYLDVFQIKKELGMPKTYTISCNGARVHGPNNELLIEHNINDNIANEILKLEIEEDVTLCIFTDEKITIFSEKDLWEYEGRDIPYELREIKGYKAKNPIKWFYHSTNHEKLVALDNKIKEKWGNEVDTMFSMEECLEIMPKNISKGYAIKEIAKLESINVKDILAFGDGFNDLEMLSVVGKGIIMENASEKLKKALSDNEIIGKNYEDSVAKYLKKLYL